ncbi:B12-binding domain-containing radical SAM protein [Thermospira aquatica]|uniref:Radical SAM protein n=1 Tax=Thermospira aquatica TaxID=2828656 RepID=A0AAX3BBN7_9SPIR|nr:radical SAM protein [Thermospira aquatica]URA09696.1 radical SAM protein [Thermospira aquatica]
MRICVTYPPLESPKGVPLLSQNRQFQWFNNPTFIYPVVPASAATLLKSRGYDVLWLDGIAERLTLDAWFDFLKRSEITLVAMETKTPVIKKYWEIVQRLKTEMPGVTVVLMGDHVTALPEETLQACPVDYVLTGGDYDFLLLSLVDFLSGRVKTLEPGFYYREGGKIVSTGPFQRKYDLSTLPWIDRDLTKWENYAYHNGNYKYTPGTYIMAGRDCWYHQCTFCSWTTIYPTFNKRSVEDVLDEVGMLIEKYRVREIMDDTGTFPVGEWLESFCEGMIRRGYHKKVTFDCNMRLGKALTYDQMKLMKRANFRLVLVGIESANQTTLDRVKKGETIEEMVANVKLMRKAGLYPHITIMFGYPWETEEDAKRTLELGRELLIKNYAYTMQATVVVPYPGTPLFEECKRNGWLVTEDWDRYDMREPVMKTPMSEEVLMKYVQGLYSVAFHPGFLVRKILSIRDIEDVKYFWRAGMKVLGHILDFGEKK